MSHDSYDDDVVITLRDCWMVNVSKPMRIDDVGRSIDHDHDVEMHVHRRQLYRINLWSRRSGVGCGET